jgi:hypothetical protein
MDHRQNVKPLGAEEPSWLLEVLPSDDLFILLGAKLAQS